MLEDKEANLIALRDRMKARTEESFKPKNTFKLSSKIDKNGKVTGQFFIFLQQSKC